MFLWNKIWISKNVFFWSYENVPPCPKLVFLHLAAELLAFKALSANKLPTNNRHPPPTVLLPRLLFASFSCSPFPPLFSAASYSLSLSSPPPPSPSIIHLAALRIPAAGWESPQSCFSWTLQHTHLLGVRFVLFFKYPQCVCALEI